MSLPCLHTNRCKSRVILHWLVQSVGALFLATVLMPAWSAGQVYDEITWAQLDQEIQKNYEAGRYAEARDDLKRAIQLIPKNFSYGQSMTQLAWCHHSLGDHSQAVRAASEAMTYTSSATEPKQLRIRASLLHLMGRLKCCERACMEARQFFIRSQDLYRRLRAQSKERAALLVSWAELERQELDYQLVKQKLKQAIAVAGNEPEVMVDICLCLADLLIDLGEYADAEDYLRQSKRPSPKRTVTRGYLLARLEFAYARYRNAINILQSLEQGPTRCYQSHCTCWNRVLVLWARSLVRVGEFDEVDSKLAGLHATHPWEETLHRSDRQLVAAEKALAFGDFANAKLHFQQALRHRESVLQRQDPEHSPLLLGLAHAIEFLGGTHAETRALCRRVRQIYQGIGAPLHPNVGESQLISARNESFLLRPDQAERVFARPATTLLEGYTQTGPHPTLARAYDVLAQTLWLQGPSGGSTDVALDELNKALAVHSNHLAANNIDSSGPLGFSLGETELIFGWIALCEGRLDDAEMHFAQSADHLRAGDQFHPLNAEAELGRFLSRGRVEDNLGRSAEHYLIERLGIVSTAYFYACRGDVCRRYGRLEEARWLIERALKLYLQSGRTSSDRDVQSMRKQLEALTQSRPEIVPPLAPGVPPVFP